MSKKLFKLSGMYNVNYTLVLDEGISNTLGVSSDYDFVSQLGELDNQSDLLGERQPVDFVETNKHKIIGRD